VRYKPSSEMGVVGQEVEVEKLRSALPARVREGTCRFISHNVSIKWF